MPENSRLSWHFERTYRPLKLSNSSATTVVKYRIAIAKLGDFLGHNPTVDDLDDEIITAYLGWMVSEGLAEPTANSYGSKIMSLWTYLAKRRIADKFPTFRLLREPRRIPVTWTREQRQTLHRAIQSLKGKVSGTPAALWWSGLVRTLEETAERRGAVLGFRWDDLDDETGWLVSRAENRKGKTEDLAFRLHPETLGILRQFARVSDLMFHWEKCRASLFNNFRRILQDAGLPSDRKRMFQCFRRTTATEIEIAGGDATELLGHSERKITLTYYLDRSKLRKIQPSDIIRKPEGPDRAA